ncbi:MAG: precorrin-3B synthase [Elainella sp.]
MSVLSRQGDPPDPLQAIPERHSQKPLPVFHPAVSHPAVPYPAICPGLFRPSLAQDGYLVRIRVPGGQLSAAQCRVLASVCEAVGHATGNSERNGSQNHPAVGPYLEVTNRANLQLRGLPGAMPLELLTQLQTVQLAAHPSIDHLRNLMASPTAGIDPEQLLDTRPLVAALDAHLAQQLSWSGLSAKFSVGFDGGEQVSIQQQPNDLRFTALRDSPTGLHLHLHLAGVDPAYGNLLLGTEALQSGASSTDPHAWIEPVIATVTAVVQLYLEAVDPTLERKPRLKQVLTTLAANLPQRLCQLGLPLRTTAPLPSRPFTHRHLGVQAQHQPQFAYVGLALPLGQITARQLRQLADLLESWGLGLRLTPWRTLLLSQVPRAQVAALLFRLAALGLDQAHNPIWSNLVACSGSTGCAASTTDTQADARVLAETLAGQLSTTDLPLPTIHLSGCAKSCAHHGSSDITLVGTQNADATGYQLYLGDWASSVAPVPQPFGQLVTPPDQLLRPAELPQVLIRLLAQYRSGQTAPAGHAQTGGA